MQAHSVRCWRPPSVFGRAISRRVSARLVVPGASSEFAVVAFLQCVVQIGGGVGLAVVFDLFVALDLNHAAANLFDALKEGYYGKF